MDTNENVRKEISLYTIRIRRVDHSCRFCKRLSSPSSFTDSEKAPSIERTICPLDHFPLHRRAGDSERQSGVVLPLLVAVGPLSSLCPKRRRILVREKVTKNWNGKSTECPFPRWSDGREEGEGGCEGRQPGPKERERRPRRSH